MDGRHPTRMLSCTFKFVNVSDVKQTVFFFRLKVQVLFEETFFNKNDESFRVLCISQPLEGEPICKYPKGTRL